MSKLHTEPTAVVMVNLTNHPVAKWSPAQVSAALAIAPDGLTDLDGGMPVVPPAASTGDVVALAVSIVNAAWDQVSDDAGDDVDLDVCFAVQGEPTLTHHIVRYAESRGWRCYAATTDRKAVETVNADGTVTKTSVFEFVQWRSF